MKTKKKNFFRHPLFIASVLLIGLPGVALVSCSEFGASPKGAYLLLWNNHRNMIRMIMFLIIAFQVSLIQ